MHNGSTVNIFTLANIITALRMLVAPVFFFLLIQADQWAYSWAFLLFVAAALTDFADGIMARRFGEISSLGMFLDPLADKILVLSALFGFVWLGLIPLWMVIIVAIRDAYATVLRVWSFTEGRALVPSRIAKWKTFAQMGFVSSVLALLVAASSDSGAVSQLARTIIESGALTWAMGGVVLLTIGSLLGYLLRRQ
ncbi:MAG: hypothetical protein AA908_02865 [Chlorobi bacterium NICIL-2]|nr:MAG: hypothetical protein AA908_02865 [Chlorobi bacterium NICIL-2]